jgi:hypothetical protein
METYSSRMNCPKEKCVSADLMHLFLVRFVTVRLTYIFIDYPDCEYIIILNTSIVINWRCVHFPFFVKFCYISIILIVNRCVCIILVFVNKQAFWRWRFPNMGIEGEPPEGKMCFCRSNALIPCSFCDSKINIYIYWLPRLWIYHYFEYVDCNIWFLALVSLAKLHPFNAHICRS